MRFGWFLLAGVAVAFAGVVAMIQIGSCASGDGCSVMYAGGPIGWVVIVVLVTPWRSRRSGKAGVVGRRPTRRRDGRGRRVYPSSGRAATGSDQSLRP